MKKLEKNTQQHDKIISKVSGLISNVISLVSISFEHISKIQEIKDIEKISNVDMTGSRSDRWASRQVGG